MLIQIILLFLSLIILYLGANFALESAEKIGKILKMSPLIIGMVIIGFGTSLPEFFVSQLSAYKNHPQIAIGNILGSNIANVCLILGISSLFTTLHLQKIRNQLLMHIYLSVLLLIVFLRQKIDYVTLFLLGTFFIFYLYRVFLDLKKENKIELESKDKIEQQEENLKIKEIGLLILGFFLLYIGGDLLVSSGSKVAIYFGVSEYFISVFLVAFGTSFPELVTAILACLKKKNVDLITGNIIGSNIFNVSLVLSSLGIYNFKLESIHLFETISIVIISVVLYLLSFWPKVINKVIGILFLAIYCCLIYYV